MCLILIIIHYQQQEMRLSHNCRESIQIKQIVLTINFKTSVKCRLQLEPPPRDSQTKLSTRNSLCDPPHGA